MRLAQLTKKADKLVRTFAFLSRTNRPIALMVTLEYLPRPIYNEEVEQTKTRILADPRFINIADVEQREEAESELHYKVLASRVRKITAEDGTSPVTPAILSAILDLSPADIRRLGGPGTAIPFDRDDQAEASDEERIDPVTGKVNPLIKTRGDVALWNIFDLLQGSKRFETWVFGVIQDVSYFQDKTWLDELGNSQGQSSATAPSVTDSSILS